MDGLSAADQQMLFDSDLSEAEKRKGVDRALRAGRVQDWKLEADRWLRELPRGSSFTADDVILAVGFLPDVGSNRNNVVGAHISGWAQSHVIVDTGGRVRARRVVSHGREIRVWRKR